MKLLFERQRQRRTHDSVRTGKRRVLKARRRPAGIPATWRMAHDGTGRHIGGQGLSAHAFEEWAMILGAARLPHVLKGNGASERLYTPAFLHTRTLHELSPRPVQPTQNLPSAPVRHNAHYAMACLVILLLWHGVTHQWWPLPFVSSSLEDTRGLGDMASRANTGNGESETTSGVNLPSTPDAWAKLGRLSVADVRLHGEYFRVFTALTLHAGSEHIFGNILFATPFFVLLCRRAGLGLALWLTIMAGALGNAMTALYHPLSHNSVGFSTALFGCVGALTALMAVAESQRQWRRGVLMLAAGLAALALLGTEGLNTDYAAHIFGLLAGISLGTLTGIATLMTQTQTLPHLKMHIAPHNDTQVAPRDTWPRWIENILGASAVLALLAAWLWALTHQSLF